MVVACDMNDCLKQLKPGQRRGSKPRCHSITHGPSSAVARRLSDLGSPFATVTCDDRWMPQGFDDLEEAQLHSAPHILDSGLSVQLRDWWLAPASRRALTPNWDIASTCTIEGRSGLLLVEAKAHEQELETAGRKLERGESGDRAASHDQIGRAIERASAGLTTTTSLEWSISRDVCYQMSNRFAWAWKLTELGLPVVLVYLGFLRAEEMRDRSAPFGAHAEWERLVRAHSQPLFPGEVWDKPWSCNGQFFAPLIRSLEVPLPSSRSPSP